ncbi:M6 family metalloprotease domain-containing protein [Streptomyces sp. LX-29]|uniref:M6 family metalloprotease domain-containing protein n=1 Tax=Streptomyces sp. LX-29 TaxID=2900152 RepID=UPI00240D892E|nr:M6 family metalloprotease domain-containing protein [Streptomyces sp. LX-29]WFB07777.1 M6 family metalloprotease domain-containing protein [Streptomyces sp. LX-29]
MTPKRPRIPPGFRIRRRRAGPRIRASGDHPTGRHRPHRAPRTPHQAGAPPLGHTPPRGRTSRRGRALATAAALLLAVAAPATAPHIPAAPRPIHAPALRGSAAAGRAACTPPRPHDVAMSEGMPTAPGYSRSTGTVRALTLMIDFPDVPGEGSARERFAEFFPQTARWFARGSYGRLDYRATAPLDHWLRMPRTFRSYGLRRGSGFEPGYRALVRDIAAAADHKVDFRRYDLINVLLTPNAGPPAARTVLSVTFSGNTDAPRADGVPLANVSFVYSRQDDGSGSLTRTGFRVLPHENGHSFGLPDLYTGRGGDRVGHWDVMSEDWGVGNDLMAWHKWKLGWLTPAQVVCAARAGTSTHTLSPLGRRGGGAKLLFVPVSTSGGYTVEARTNEGNDDGVCKPGVLVSWVDVGLGSGDGPITVIDASPKSRGCTREPNVHPGLSDATFTPGESLRDAAHGIRIGVTTRDGHGAYRVEVTRRPPLNR